jgi:hypothetical protein
MMMNAADRTEAQAALIKAITAALDGLEMQGVNLPLLGDSTIHHMANAALNVLETIDDIETTLRSLLPEDVSNDLGI